MTEMLAKHKQPQSVWLVTEFEKEHKNIICVCSTLEIARNLCTEDGFTCLSNAKTLAGEVWTVTLRKGDEFKTVLRRIEGITYIN
jgi:hypothetical protein